MITETLELTLCKHCSTPVPSSRNDFFCCAGCKAVFELLSTTELCDYYEIRKRSGTFKKPSPVKFWSEKGLGADPFAYLDVPSFRQDLGINSDQPQASFYLEGVHCTACMWLIEKLPEILPQHVANARLNLQQSVVKIEFHPQGSITETARALERMGYSPHLIKTPEQVQTLEKKDTQSFLLKLVVAGAAAGNIMLFAAAIYTGAGGWVKTYFDWIVFVISLPVFGYSALPLYQNAYHALQNRRWSVDIPIVIALAAGFMVSALSVWRGTDQNYLDSLTGLIFLLLATRYLLMRLQKNAFEGMQFFDSLVPVQVLNSLGQMVWVRDLKKQDCIEIPAGLTIPVDGVIQKGTSQINEAVLTGESIPRIAKVNDQVYSGTINLESPLWVEVQAVADDTRMGKILQEIQQFDLSAAPTVRMSEQVAKYFTGGVLVWSLGLWIYLVAEGGSVLASFERILSVLIVSCPCAFAIATPLALIQAYQILIKKGLYLKNPASLDSVTPVKRVAFDKTGTLTLGQFEVQHWEWSKSISPADRRGMMDCSCQLEAISQHPLSKAWRRYGEAFLSGITYTATRVSHFVEVPGNGISGIVDGHSIELKPSSGASELRSNDTHSGFTSVDFIWNGALVAHISFKDELRKDIPMVIRQLKQLGLEVWMLSGDQKAPCWEVARQVGIEDSNVLFCLTPETKSQWIKNHPETLYLGDGANDGLALKNAHLGIAVHGALDLSLKAAQGYLIQNRMAAVLDLFTVSSETQKVLVRHLIFTVVYNGATIAIASKGMLHPLFAAVLMPTSSLLVLVSTIWGTKALRKLKVP